MMYVEFMKNFLLADSSELMAVRLDHFGLLSPKTFYSKFDFYFLDITHVVRRVHEKFSYRPLERADGC